MCNHAQGCRIDKNNEILEPVRCAKCNADHAFILSHNESVYRDKQLIKIQEMPESIPEGETPHTVALYVFQDLFDSVRPGDRVEVTGYHTLTHTHTHTHAV